MSSKNNFTSVYFHWLKEVKPTIANVDWQEVKKYGIIDADFYLADILSKENITLNTPPAKAGGFTVATKVAFRLKPVWPLLKQAEVIPPQFGRFHLHLPVA